VTTERTAYEPIPQPPGYPVLGNLFDVKRGADTPIQALMKLARQYGPIFRLRVGSSNLVVVSGFDLVDELSDDERFDKMLGRGLLNARAVAGDGLFTSWTQEPNWRKAHNILLPSFSARAIKDYFPMMTDIAMQLVEKWERLNPDEEIDVPAEMTRLTLDTIGLCGFDYRFNSFYREEPHPFVASMVRCLDLAMQQQTRLSLGHRLRVREHRQFHEDTTYMNSLVDKIIAERRGSAEEAQPKDLLNAMLTGVDRETGEPLDDVNIRYQIITFLIAGHETTSGLLSFALYFLLNNREVLERAYEEVDRVLGDELSVAPTYAQVRRLRYVSQVLKESLRLWPTAPAFTRHAYEPTVLGGKYQLDKQTSLTVLTPMLHRDPKVWGENPEEFDPERFAPEAEQSIPTNAYKPFGTGQRACIGRQFAMLEATLVLGMILQRFEPVDYTNYELKLKQTLTIKPADFRIRVRARTSRSASAPAGAPPAEQPPVAEQEEPDATPAAAVVQGSTPLLSLYGSNLGTAEGIAHQIAGDARTHGFSTTVAPLDDYVDKLPREGAVVITTSSYNGTPPDNAARFFEWLCNDSLEANALKDVSYTVFGCGDHDWAATYQRVPKMIDASMESHGAKRIYERGEGDASDDFDGEFRGWYDHLFGSLASALGTSIEAPETVVHGHRYEVEVITEPTEEASPLVAEYDARPMEILANRELQNKSGAHPSERSTRHIELALPEGVTYQAGHHLGVLPHNGEALVRRVLERFELSGGALIRIRNNTRSKTFLPVDRAVPVSALLSRYLDLQGVARRSEIQVLAEYTECPPEKEKLLALGSDDPDSVARYREEILEKNVSLIDLLEEHRSCELPFNIYLELLPALRPRYYSISSSPLLDPKKCSITVGVIDAPARSGRGEYRGVCSAYLAELPVGSVVEGFVRPPSTPFVPPEDPATPMIMVAAGTGLAPFRGFLQERAVAKKQGKQVGQSSLFFGCRNPEQDYIYEEELEEFAREGITDLECAFSRVEGQPKTYVQNRIEAQREEIWPLLEGDATVYVCGDAGRMAPDVERAFVELFREEKGASEEEAEGWMAELKASSRYLLDVWPRN
jgi:cytochrome P450 / NADPH-cytochrome P450 reductase